MKHLMAYGTYQDMMDEELDDRWWVYIIFCIISSWRERRLSAGRRNSKERKIAQIIKNNEKHDNQSGHDTSPEPDSQLGEHGN